MNKEFGRSVKGQLKDWARPLVQEARYVKDALVSRFRPADLSFFYDFVSPPYGGGNQFLLALWTEFDRRGYRLENNTISPTTRACLFNSFNFDDERLRRFDPNRCRTVHRVDGPVTVYRGRDDGTDRRVRGMNHEFADATVFQSEYSLRKTRELGFEFENPTVIHNAPDPAIFHREGKTPFDRNRKIRLISTSWSDNPNKGGPTYAWLDEHLDWDRYEYTFVGRAPVEFDNIKKVDPVPPQRVAELLRQHDVFITASRHEACSNALLEALTCGLPAIYIDSGSNAELAGEGGRAYNERNKIPDALDGLVKDYETVQDSISVPTIAEVADQYLDVLFPDRKPTKG